MNLHKVLLLTHRVSWAFHLFCFFFFWCSSLALLSSLLLMFLLLLLFLWVVTHFLIYFHGVQWTQPFPQRLVERWNWNFIWKTTKVFHLFLFFQPVPLHFSPSLSPSPILTFQMLPRTQNTRKVSTNKPITYVANIFHHAMPCNNYFVNWLK